VSPPEQPDLGSSEPVLDVDIAFGHHLLALGPDVEPDEVEMLAMSWFPRAGWVGDRVLALTEDAVLTGPWSVDAGVRRALRLRTDTTQAYLLRCPVLRGGAAPAHLAAADPLTRAFRDGVPHGVEAEALAFLLAAARRLAGALRAAGSGAVLVPDPAADVNLLLHSAVWLDPDALVATLRPVLPAVRLATELADFAPRAAPIVPEVPGLEPMDEGEREWLHAEAEAFDEAALSGPAVLDAYGAVADLGEDGILEVAVAGEEHIPLVLERLDWTASGVVAYSVQWWPPDEEAAAAEVPDAAFRAARERARADVERAARALYEAAGGELTDESGFLVEPESLA
jgi:hypothetical protein